LKVTNSDDRRQIVLGGLHNPSVPLDIVDRGVFFSIHQGLMPDLSRPNGIHRYRYEYRIGAGPEKSDWLFRYEFVENPSAEYEGQYLYATSHMHVNATAAPKFVADLPSRHFPTGKLWLEDILAGVCADIVLPRVRARSDDEGPTRSALSVIQSRIALLSAN
jgi:hypothetical protein